jgi:hypothetical protein
MAEQMGWEDFDDEPIDPAELSLEAQQALVLMNILPDKIEGMNGVWLGKEYSGLSDILTIYEMVNWRDTFDMLQICIQQYSKFYDEKRKQEERKAKAGAKFK